MATFTISTPAVSIDDVIAKAAQYHGINVHHENGRITGLGFDYLASFMCFGDERPAEEDIIDAEKFIDDQVAHSWKGTHWDVSGTIRVYRKEIDDALNRIRDFELEGAYIRQQLSQVERLTAAIRKLTDYMDEHDASYIHDPEHQAIMDRDPEEDF